jgi:hypothetical protein
MTRPPWCKPHGRGQDAISGLIETGIVISIPTKTTLILAHRRRDVRELNELARAKLIERGIVGEGLSSGRRMAFRCFAAGDQIVFLKNEGALASRTACWPRWSKPRRAGSSRRSAKAIAVGR